MPSLLWLGRCGQQAVGRGVSPNIEAVDKRGTHKTLRQDFPGGAVVKNPPANAGDMGSIPGPGGSHIQRSN